MRRRTIGIVGLGGVALLAAVVVAVASQGPRTRAATVADALGTVLGCHASVWHAEAGDGFALRWPGVVRRDYVGCLGAIDYVPLWVTFRTNQSMRNAYTLALRGQTEPLCHTPTEIFTVLFDAGGDPKAARFCALVGATQPQLAARSSG